MEEDNKIKNDKKDNKKGLIVMLVAVLLIGFGCGILLANSTNSNSENKESSTKGDPDNNPFYNNENKTEPDVNIEVDEEQLLAPFLIFKSCGGINYLKDSVTFDSMPHNIKLEIAYVKLMNGLTYANEISISDYLKAFKEVFGSNKEIDFPQALEINSAFATYSKQGDKYVLEGQGGGCIGIDEYVTKIKNTRKSGSLLEITVDYGYITTISKEVDDFDTAECGFYNSMYKTRLLKQGFTIAQKDSIVEEVFASDKSDYIVFTFKADNDRYVFDNLKVVER